jgi:hypothetical protein
VAIFLAHAQTLIEQLEGELEALLGREARFGPFLLDVPLLDGHPPDTTIHDVFEV